MINNVITQEFTYILVDGLLKVGPGKTKNNPGKVLENSWNFLTKKVYEPWYYYSSLPFIMSPPHFCGETYCFCPVRLSICLSICPSQFVSATPLKLLNRISWNLVDSKDTICSCAYYQEILLAWILWELCPFELRNFPNLLLKQLVSATPETTEQNFMKLGRY